MKYRIVVEAIIDIGDNNLAHLPYAYQPQGRAEQLAIVAILDNNIGAEDSKVISIEEITDEDQDSI
mgnify:CR=1 FL=1